ncbi:MAG: signal recognition particle protein [Candidatus Melainabacteria bacterium RIFOXYA12_FULL_32_12]|nr:MAG: signal recognition particle protein [Candidatus Melainabacteria bacterium RIFOXYA2_FULL_32_9]OGI26877.1 MAG: signal recognition particle protein [Candidatus Melainabacteria bacterium RIFOXYA12_FULL_32_12]
MFEALSDRLQEAVKNASGQGTLTEDNITEALREVRRALLEADVSLKIVKAFISKIKDRAHGEEVLKSLTPGQQLVKVVYDELVELLGGEHKPISTEGKPNIIMLFGLQGSGKTTSAAKLAVRIRKNGRNPLLVAADVYRPAAIKQLQSLGKQINAPVYAVEDSTDVRSIVSSAIDYAKENGHNTVIVDTAGRLQIDTELMAELVILDRLFTPAEKLLVIDSMTGQAAVGVAETFNEQLGITGIVLTKLDGDARGGAALSVVHATGKPIKFAGMGEKLDALEPFYPDRMAQRILGMGDVLSLIEKAQESFDVESAKELERKMRTKEFSLEDFMKIQKQMKMLGSLDQILGMLPIPGMSKTDREQIAHVGEKQLKRIEACVNSMTLGERRNPDIINPNRKRRIAKGSGIPVDEINRFLKEFENMRKMMKKMTDMTKTMKGNPNKMMHKLPPGLRGKFPPF